MKETPTVPMRLCSLNVHLWSDRAGRGNVDRLIELLGPLGCDLIALQEVVADGPQLERLARSLGMRHAVGAESWIGNALLTPHALEDVAVTAVTAGAEEGRCVVAATVVGPTGRLDVASTHLDPGYEDTRLGELERLVAALGQRAPAHAVFGDFNALRLEDYTLAALAAVREGRATHDREEPRGDAVARMDAAGYVDLVRLARAGDLGAYREALRAPLAYEDRVTCWFGTRVDYAWASPALLARYAVARATHVRTDATDHAAVLVELAESAGRVPSPPTR